MSLNNANTPAEITYHWDGDYLIPDIGIPNVEDSLLSLSRWGLMRKEYLKNHRRIIYIDLKLAGKLFLHCHEIEEQANERMNFMVKQLMNRNPISEDLKNTDPLAWVAYMNSLKSQVEGIIKAELIYE